MNNEQRDSYSQTDQYSPDKATQYQEDDFGTPSDNSLTNNKNLSYKDDFFDENYPVNDSEIDPDDDYPDHDVDIENDFEEDFNNENDLGDEEDFQEDDINDPDDDPDDTRPINPSQF